MPKTLPHFPMANVFTQVKYEECRAHHRGAVP